MTKHMKTKFTMASHFYMYYVCERFMYSTVLISRFAIIIKHSFYARFVTIFFQNYLEENVLVKRKCISCYGYKNLSYTMIYHSIF